MVNISPRIIFAQRAVAFRFQRSGVFAVTGVADIDRPVSGKGLRRPSGAGRHNAVKHINPAQNCADNIVGTSDPHQVAGLVLGQHARRVIQNFKHGFLAFADRQSADGITVKTDFAELLGRKTAQVFKNAALLNAENAVPVAVDKSIAAASGPAH